MSDDEDWTVEKADKLGNFASILVSTLVRTHPPRDVVIILSGAMSLHLRGFQDPEFRQELWDSTRDYISQEVERAND